MRGSLTDVTLLDRYIPPWLIDFLGTPRDARSFSCCFEGSVLGFNTMNLNRLNSRGRCDSSKKKNAQELHNDWLNLLGSYSLIANRINQLPSCFYIFSQLMKTLKVIVVLFHLTQSGSSRCNLLHLI